MASGSLKSSSSACALSKKGVCLHVKVHPRASRTGVTEVTEAYLKVSLQSPPVDNEANKELTLFLSKYFHLPKNAIHIKTGTSGRLKMIELEGASLEEIVKIINEKN